MRQILFVLLALAACAGDSGPQLSEWRDGVYVDLELNSHSVDGKRDGARTVVDIHLAPMDGEALQLQLEIRYDPTPVLGVGIWTRGSERGDVRAESVDFAGGQGEGPSVGGVFLLEMDGEPRYRLKLPLQPVMSKQWTVG